MANQDLATKEYDFSGKDPGVVLTEDELENFDKGMKLTNKSRSSKTINFKKAVQFVVSELDELLS